MFVRGLWVGLNFNLFRQHRRCGPELPFRRNSGIGVNMESEPEMRHTSDHLGIVGGLLY
jgi:hypothetical protein